MDFRLITIRDTVMRRDMETDSVMRRRDDFRRIPAAAIDTICPRHKYHFLLAAFVPWAALWLFGHELVDTIGDDEAFWAEGL